MDPLSLSCNIIGVLTAAGQLISAGYSYGSSVKDFPREIRDLVGELSTLSGILHALKALMDSSADGTTTNTNPGEIAKAIEVPIKDCEKLLKDMLGCLDNYQKPDNKVKKFVKRLAWPLKESETKSWIEKISRYKATFSLALSADGMILTRKICADLEEVRITQKMDSEEKKLAAERQNLRKIMGWLSSANPEQNHKAAQNLRQMGTGRWLTEGDTFRNWSDENQSFLWLYGIPGSGKTILSSLVIDHILSKINRNIVQDCAIAYFYCDFKEYAKQTAISFLGSIITQLIRQGAGLPKELEELNDKVNGPLRPYHAESLQTILHSLAGKFSKLVIVVDAIDECSERPEILESLKQLKLLQNLNLLLTSRDEFDIRQELEAFPSLAIKQKDTTHDIELFVTEKIEENPKLARLKHTMKSEIVQTLAKKSQGMFLWASTCLIQIGKLRNDRAIKDALNSLPRTLEDTYERILCKITTEDKPLATRIFQWLVCSCSKSLLTLAELVDGIAVEISSPFMDPNNRLNDPKDIVEICGGLVIVEEGSMNIGLLHLSVKEYLLSARTSEGPAAIYRIWPDVVNKELAKICLTYILFDDFDVGPSLSEDEFRARIQQYSLLAYAARCWPKHALGYASGTDETLDQLISTFFRLNEGSGKILSWKQAYRAAEAIGDRIVTCFKSYLSPCSQKEQTMLYYAADFGQLGAVRELLLDSNWSEAEASEYAWPLKAAVESGHEKVVRLLLESGADPDCPTRGSTSPLAACAAAGHIDCFQTLLEYGAEDNYASGDRFEGVFQSLGFNRNEKFLEVMLGTKHFEETGSDRLFERTLSLCAYAGFENSLRVLLRKGSDLLVSTENAEFMVTLRMAAEGGNLKELQTILQQGGIRVMYAKEELYTEVLQGAAYFGHDKVVELLLTLRKSSGIGRLGISLHFAAANGHIKVLECLLRAGANPEVEDKDGWDPILCASQYHQDFALEKLLKEVKNPESLKMVNRVGPTRWVIPDMPPGYQAYMGPSILEISDNGLEVKNMAPVGIEREPQSAKTQYPMTPLCDEFYFEVEIINCPSGSDRSKALTIGFVDGHCVHTIEGIETHFREPGEAELSWGYNNTGDIRGECFFGAQMGLPNFETGDIIGCCFDRIKRTAFFTFNGSKVGTPIEDVKGKLFPLISLSAGHHIRANFGDEPFIYGIPAM